MNEIMLVGELLRCIVIGTNGLICHKQQEFKEYRQISGASTTDSVKHVLYFTEIGKNYKDFTDRYGKAMAEKFS